MCPRSPWHSSGTISSSRTTWYQHSWCVQWQVLARQGQIQTFSDPKISGWKFKKNFWAVPPQTPPRWGGGHPLHHPLSAPAATRPPPPRSPTLDPPLWQGTLMKYNKVPWQHLPVNIYRYLLWVKHFVNSRIISGHRPLVLLRWLNQSRFAFGPLPCERCACKYAACCTRRVLHWMLYCKIDSTWQIHCTAQLSYT